jgi:hypothetical protein
VYTEFRFVHWNLIGDGEERCPATIATILRPIPIYSVSMR